MTLKELRALDEHAALHRLEKEAVKIARACINITNLYQLNVYATPRFDTTETEAIMKLAEAMMLRAKARHEALAAPENLESLKAPAKLAS